ncbi:MAG: NAD-dependent epimerase/dehydratase family protein [Acutalibacteraceae bacterium]
MTELKKVIITGPTGSVGISLIEELIEKGIEITAICREHSDGIENIPKNHLIQVVECNLENLESLFGKLSCSYDAFYHLGWDGTYGEARRDLRRQIKNVLYSVDAVELAHRLGCKVFVGAGSQSEFGHVDGILHPDLPCNPDNGYGVGKLMAGQMTRLKCKEYGIRHEWVRIVSMYGPHDRTYTMVMSSILKMLKGERVQFTKGDQIWDYIYNKDAARAFRMVAENGKDGSIYLFGTGKPRKLREYICMIRDAVDPNLEIGLGELDYYPNQVMHLEADISNLTADTGFIPQYSFEDGIREMIGWVKKEKLR